MWAAKIVVQRVRLKDITVFYKTKYQPFVNMPSVNKVSLHKWDHRGYKTSSINYNLHKTE